MAEQIFQTIFSIGLVILVIVFGLKMIAGVVTGDFRIFPHDDEDDD